MQTPPMPGTQTFDTEAVLRCISRHQILRMSVEVTKQCNLDCIYCYTPVTPNHDHPLKFDEILDIAKQGRLCGAQTFVVIGGEPLLYKRLKELIAELFRMGFSINMFSNLCFLTRELTEYLRNHQVFITGKFNSFDNSKQNQFTRCNNSYELFIRGISLLKNGGFCDEVKPLMALHSVIAKENVTEIPDLFRWMRSQNIIPHLQLLTRVGRARDGMTPLSPQEAKNLFESLLRIDETEFGYSWIPTPPIVGWTCQQYYCSLYVVNDGRVKVCSSTQTVLGSIREMSLEDILHMPFLKKLRTPRDYISGPCKTCKAHPTCYGCRADAEGICGTPFAPDQYCWR